MSKSNLQINLEYLVARSLLFVFGLLSLRMSLFLGTKLGAAAYYFSGRLRRTGQRNLELAFPNLSQPERRRLLRGCFENMGRLLGVFSHFTNHPESLKGLHDLVDQEGFEHLEVARQNGRG